MYTNVKCFKPLVWAQFLLKFPHKSKRNRHGKGWDTPIWKDAGPPIGKDGGTPVRKDGGTPSGSDGVPLSVKGGTLQGAGSNKWLSGASFKFQQSHKRVTWKAFNAEWARINPPSLSTNPTWSSWNLKPFSKMKKKDVKIRMKSFDVIIWMSSKSLI